MGIETFTSGGTLRPRSSISDAGAVVPRKIVGNPYPRGDLAARQQAEVRGDDLPEHLVQRRCRESLEVGRSSGSGAAVQGRATRRCGGISGAAVAACWGGV